MQKSFTFVVVFALVFSAAATARCQMAPAGRSGNALLSVGTGASSWDVDWANGRMLGITEWIDAHPPVPSRFNGLGLEFEGREVNWDQQTQLSNFK